MRCFAAPAASVIGVSGDVKISAGGSGAWRAAAMKQSLNEGDQIRTGPDSGAALLFDNGTELKIGALSALTIQSHSGSKDGDNTMIGLTKGRIWAKVN